GGFWNVTNRRRHDAVPDDSRGEHFARDLLCSLCLHLPVRYVLHLSAYPHRAPWQSVRDAASRGSEPADVAGRRRTDSTAKLRHRWRIAMFMPWLSLFATSILL